MFVVLFVFQNDECNCACCDDKCQDNDDYRQCIVCFLCACIEENQRVGRILERTGADSYRYNRALAAYIIGRDELERAVLVNICDVEERLCILIAKDKRK